LINFVAFHARHDLENTPFQGQYVANKEELLAPFTDWEPEARLLLNVRDLTSHSEGGLGAFIDRLLYVQLVENPTKWAIHTVKPLRSYIYRRVALLGDAVSSDYSVPRDY
jgi:salicylate hydroxylase